MSDNSRVRVNIVGVIIVALFASLLARLWFLQVGPEKALGQEAIALSTRTIQTPAPRGAIVDRYGHVLVQDRAAWAIAIDRNLKKHLRTQVLGQLSELLGVPEPILQAAYDSPRQSPLEPAILAVDVPFDKRLALQERQEDYPGVHVEELTVRSYPSGPIASQVLGYTGEIGPDQLKQLQKQGYQAGDLVGRDGVEAAYESVLHGAPERVTVNVDPTGKQIGAPVTVQQPTVGDEVQLTIDARVQKAAEQALADGIQAARKQQDRTVSSRYATLQAPGGAAVVLDAHDGSVIAMASNPTYPLSWWVGGINSQNFGFLTSPLSNDPLLNRATEGQYAPGSSFKLVTSLAMTRYGMRGPFETYDDTGSVHIGNLTFVNDNNAVNGIVSLSSALKVSSDTFFYTIGNAFWQTYQFGDQARGLGLQQQAHDLGFGSKTGIEVDENTGRIPDPTWKKQFANAYYKDPTAKEQNSIWYPGDEVHLAVGQGDVLVTPLQLADAYAAFANGGTLVTPHVGMSIINSTTHKVIKNVAPPPRAHLGFDPTTYGQMLQGFESVVSDPKGTAYAAFQGFPLNQIPVAGKTGTAQVAGKGPTSVFASFFPANAPKYVVVVFVEQGGYGADTAAPIARRIIESIVNPAAGSGPGVIPLPTTGRD
jgi:penicillin-binding protein 2